MQERSCPFSELPPLVPESRSDASQLRQELGSPLAKAEGPAAASAREPAHLVSGTGCGAGALQVWWPLESSWFEGAVTAFEEIKLRHRVNYNDGDVELLKLWAPTETVR